MIIGSRDLHHFGQIAFGDRTEFTLVSQTSIRHSDKLKNLNRNNINRYRKGIAINQPPPRGFDSTTKLVPYVTRVFFTQTTPAINGRNFNQIKLQWSRPPDQRVWFQASVYVRNYRANPNWVMISRHIQSPATFLFEQTAENIQMAVASEDQFGRSNDVTKAPTVGVQLV